jgi:uncharacterized membrane protein YuzA (DUF378 family)
VFTWRLIKSLLYIGIVYALARMLVGLFSVDICQAFFGLICIDYIFRVVAKEKNINE